MDEFESAAKWNICFRCTIVLNKYSCNVGRIKVTPDLAEELHNVRWAAGSGQFRRALQRGGTLVLGCAETIINLHDGFSTESIDGAIVYVSRNLSRKGGN